MSDSEYTQGLEAIRERADVYVYHSAGNYQHNLYAVDGHRRTTYIGTVKEERTAHRICCLLDLHGMVDCDTAGGTG